MGSEMCIRDSPNVLILYTREVVLGKADEVYRNCKQIFTEHNYTIIDAVVINVEEEDLRMQRLLFERHNSKLPIPVNLIFEKYQMS